MGCISWKESVSFLSILAPTIAQVPKYIGKAHHSSYSIITSTKTILELLFTFDSPGSEDG